MSYVSALSLFDGIGPCGSSGLINFAGYLPLPGRKILDLEFIFMRLIPLRVADTSVCLSLSSSFFSVSFNVSLLKFNF